MGRWEPDARGRLERAALDLYAQRGYDQTTVAEIAAHAGLTERTFFRHFTDKREVLFRGTELADMITAALAAAPGDASPFEAATAALESVSEFFADRRAHARTRQQVIDATPSLRERELIKLASLAAAIANGLRDRGAPDATANLVAEAGIAVFKVAFDHWLGAEDDRDLAAHIRSAIDELRSATRP